MTTRKQPLKNNSNYCVVIIRDRGGDPALDEMWKGIRSLANAYLFRLRNVKGKRNKERTHLPPPSPHRAPFGPPIHPPRATPVHVSPVPIRLAPHEEVSKHLGSSPKKAAPITKTPWVDVVKTPPKVIPPKVVPPVAHKLPAYTKPSPPFFLVKTYYEDRKWKTVRKANLIEMVQGSCVLCHSDKDGVSCQFGGEDPTKPGSAFFVNTQRQPACDSCWRSIHNEVAHGVTTGELHNRVWGAKAGGW